MHLPAHLLLMILAGDYYPVSNKMPLSHKIQVCCKKWFYCRCLSFYGQQPPPPTVTLPYPPITITFLISLPRTFTQYNTVHRTSEFRPGVVYCLRGDCLGGRMSRGVQGVIGWPLVLEYAGFCNCSAGYYRALWHYWLTVPRECLDLCFICHKTSLRHTIIILWDKVILLDTTWTDDSVTAFLFCDCGVLWLLFFCRRV